MKKVLLVLLVLAMVASIFAGCTPEPVEEVVEDVVEEVVEETDEVVEEVVEEVPEEPTVFNWNIGADPRTIDPGLNGASDGGNVINQTFEGLVREKSGTVLPGIAETWDVSADGLTVTFNLRESVWSDGSPLTADDFVYSWLRAMAPATASEYSWIWHYTHVVGAEEYVSTSAISGLEATIEAGVGGVMDPDAEELEYYTQEDIDTATADLAELQMYTPDTVGIKAVDDLTFEVTLTDPTDYFVSLMAFFHFMPVKQSAVEAAGGEEGTWASNPDLAVSNGPFVLTEYTIGDGLVLVKNDNYWSADTVGIDVINGAFIDDTNTAYAAYQNGELDLLNTVPVAEIPRLKAEDPNFYIFPLLGTYYYNFNMDLEIWSDARVRRALSMAIDREKITEVMASGQAPAGGFIPPGFMDNEGRDFFATAGMYGLSTDDSSVEAAQALMAEAGYPGGEGFPEFTMLYNTSEGHQTIAELIQEMFKTNLGITCTLENQEWAVFQVTRTAGDFVLARGGWLTDFMDPIGMLGIFVPGNAYNDPNYDNADFQAALLAASETTDPAVHFAKLYEAQEIFMNDMPIIPVYHYSATILARETLIGWDRSVLGTLDFSSAYME